MSTQILTPINAQVYPDYSWAVGTNSWYFTLIPNSVILGSSVSLFSGGYSVYAEGQNQSGGCPYIDGSITFTLSAGGIISDASVSVTESYLTTPALVDISETPANTRVFIPDLTSFDLSSVVPTLSVSANSPANGYLSFAFNDGWKIHSSQLFLIPSFVGSGGGTASCAFDDTTILSAISDLSTSITTINNRLPSDLASSILAIKTDTTAIKSVVISIDTQLPDALASILTTMQTSISNINTSSGGGSSGSVDLSSVTSLITSESSSIKTMIMQKVDGSGSNTGLSIPQAQTFSLFPIGSLVTCGELGSDWEVIGYSPLVTGRDVTEHLYVLSKDLVQINSPAKYVSASVVVP